MPPNAGNSVWDQKADRDMFLAIIAEGQLSSMKWDSISAKMRAKGYSFSGNACRQHFQKLRKEAGASSPAGSARPTPVKKATAKGKKRKAVDEDEDNEDEDNEDDEEFANETPSKRTKSDKTKKEEDYDDEGFASQSHSFKQEELDENGTSKHRQVIDLEQDDLYDEEEDA